MARRAPHATIWAPHDANARGADSPHGHDHSQAPRTASKAAAAPNGKLIYTFAEGNATMRALLGGKGAGLAEMTNAGLPVPPGFTITTEACNAYYAAGKELPPGLWDDVVAHMKQLEQQTGKGFGDAENPLLVSVRSGAAFSMPGMMDTVLNLGLNPDTVEGLIRLTGNERFAWDAWRRFVAMFGRIVLDLKAEDFDEPFDELKKKAKAKLDTDLTAEQLRDVAETVRRDRRGEDGGAVPDRSVSAAGAGRARRVRLVVRQARARLPRVQQDPARPRHRGERRDHGVRQHGRRLRHRRRVHARPEHRRAAIYGEYLTNAQGEDVVAGVRTPAKISQMRDEMPEVYAQFEEIAQRLERHYRDMQDLEFTIERGTLYMLQTRSGKRTAPAAVKIAVDMVNEGSSRARRRSSGSTPRRSCSSSCRASTRPPRRRWGIGCSARA